MAVSCQHFDLWVEVVYIVTLPVRDSVAKHSLRYEKKKKRKKEKGNRCRTKGTPCLALSWFQNVVGVHPLIALMTQRGWRINQ